MQHDGGGKCNLAVAGDATDHKAPGDLQRSPRNGLSESERLSRWVLVLSDLHSGHRLGLCNPATVFEYEGIGGAIEEEPVKLTAYQRYLWDLLTRNLNSIRERVRNDRVVLVVNGDVTQGMRYPNLWMSTRLSDQVEVAIMNMTAILDALPQIDVLRIAIGTASHEFSEGSAPRMLARYLGAAYPQVDTKVLHHGLLSIGDVGFDYAHHGPGASRRVWLDGNEARYYLRDLMMREAMAGNEPPRMVIRSHVHTYIREAITLETPAGERTSEIIVTPSWCGMGDFAIQVTRSNYLIRHGALLMRVDGGILSEVIPLMERTDMRTRETV
jgi:hypothetical protein